MKVPSLVAIEFLKLRRCRVTWITLMVSVFMGIVCGLFVWIIKNPGMAESLGLVGQKVRFSVGSSDASWTTLFGMYGEMSGIGGMILISLIVTYVFGREYVEGVSKYLLSLPLSRSRMVFAKFLVSFAWFAALSVTLIAECLLVGQVLGLGPIPGAEAVAFGARTLLVTCLLFTLAPAVAWMAVGSGGFLAPLGYAIFTLMLGMVFGATDWAPWCPWAIVPLLTGAAGPARASLDPGSYVVLAVFLLVGWLGTTLWLAKADNLQ